MDRLRSFNKLTAMLIFILIALVSTTGVYIKNKVFPAAEVAGEAVEVTPEPTFNTPSPIPTPTETPTPAPKKAPVKTATPKPSATSEPTASPTTEPTSSPTSEPTASTTIAPTPTATASGGGQITN